MLASILLTVLLAVAPAESAAPRVVSTVPANGDGHVDPGVNELRVVFDSDMRQRGYSWTGGGPSFPETTAVPRWVDARTCVLPVRLVPDRTYRLGINGGSARNFRAADGVPVEPVPFVFRTAGEKPLPTLDAERNAAAIAALRRAIHTQYSYRDRTGVDWDERFAAHRAPLTAAPNALAFALGVRDLLAPTADPHLAVRAEGVAFGVPTPAKHSNFDAGTIASRVPGYGQRSPAVGFGRFEDGTGYILIGTWSSRAEAQIDAAHAALTGMIDAPALVIDVRPNGGGDENLARRFAGRFVDEEVVYAKHDRRDPETGELRAPRSRVLRPNRADGPAYPGRVAVLTGGRNMSSCEAFLLMMRQVEGCTLVGDRSYGSSGNPRRHDLGNGVVVSLPSWRAMDADGTVLEGVGIAPDVPVAVPPEAFRHADPVLDRALEILRGTP